MKCIKHTMVPVIVAMLMTTSTVVTASTEDNAGISRAITAIAAGADRGDWARVRAAFTTEVTTDYTGLWGGEPTTQTADELISAWSGFLPGFDSTHHLVSNHTITLLQDDSASAEADFIATHRIDDALWTLGGRYRYELSKVENQWQVNTLKMIPVWETGDRGLVQQAAERMSKAE